MKSADRYNLFVYGTLMDPAIFRAVLGKSLTSEPADADGVETFLASQAVLNGYKKISPDNTYLYAVPDRGHRIRGYLIHSLPKASLPALKQYEGRNYTRRIVKVQTSEGEVRAYAFVGNTRQLEHSFGYAFRDPLKQEILLQRKIDAAIRQTEAEQLHTDEEATRQAVCELSGTTIRDITRRHFEAGGVSDFAIRRLLKDQAIRDYDRIRLQPAAQPFASHYLRMVIRQVVFNQLEERLRHDFRYELDHMPSGSTQPAEFDIVYERIVSSLVALRLLNQNHAVLDVLIGDVLRDLDFARSHLIDYVRRAVVAAQVLYDRKDAKQQIGFVRTHMGSGFVPLGAEMEFSNIGHDVIRDPSAETHRDDRYDGFLYFSDFALDALTWRLGGHVDNHREKAPGRPRRGFLEVAMGNLSIEADLSKPIARDPWVLNQLIQQTIRFIEVRPHSVHISMQLRSRHKPDRNRLLPFYVIQCLLAIGGDPGPEGEPPSGGPIRIRRLTRGEIVHRDPQPSLLFCEVRKRYSSHGTETYLPAVRSGTHHSVGDAEGRYVQQFRFLRLSPDLNYEPIAMALKGVQISLRPGSFLTPQQYEESPRHQATFERLLEWGQNPEPIGRDDIDGFLGHVEEGLMTEHRGKPAHTPAYIAWSISQLREMLGRYNALFA